MVVPTEYFGANSDGYGRMEEWLHDECDGCRFGSQKQLREDHMGGMGCDLPVGALLDPYVDVEPWSADAGDKAGELVCLKRERRPPSPLKGVRRGPRQLAGQETIL